MELQTAPQDSLPREELIMAASVVGGLIFLEDFLRKPAPPPAVIAPGGWEVESFVEPGVTDRQQSPH